MPPPLGLRRHSKLQDSAQVRSHAQQGYGLPVAPLTWGVQGPLLTSTRGLGWYSDPQFATWEPNHQDRPRDPSRIHIDSLGRWQEHEQECGPALNRKERLSC